ncbi:glycosyltransferase [Colwellia sp. Arc7-635]|uniref:glycosyltransferase family 2 protein n=1 Tax=Colwellia sp. Arc7-635 TaxID=2497879 RepID=UPI000F84EBBF|nr:glycosyltransferase family 2 protein [Colwellia sp. Arc7-635]AZQ84272.1 glycosyltransferase [Colwellia sp. Arc7-635]
MQLVTPQQSIKDEITLSIIVPVFNEQEMLPIFHHHLAKVLSTQSESSFEIVYINDGSTDDSWNIMLDLESHYANIECINLSRNFGKEAAMTAGIDHAKGQAIVLLDADLQDPPELIPDMLAAWRQGYDVVNMRRSARLGESKFKCWSAHVYYRLLDYLSDVPLQKDVGDFRLLSRRVVEDIKQLSERSRYMKGILSWPGYKQTTISFERPERAAGETKWSFIQLVKLGLSGITAFSIKPLRIATWAGALISASAFIYGFWIVIKTLIFGEAVAGYPTMMLIQLFLGGVQLLSIGILGEYVGRIYAETKARPIYLIMDKEKNSMMNAMAKKHG